MILLDFHSVIIAHLMISFQLEETFSFNEDLMRHRILYSLAKYKGQFQRDYGKLIISCDGLDYWRRKEFPFYKAKRRENKEASEIDWKEIDAFMTKIKAELAQYMPYAVIEVEGAESDDIIGTIVRHVRDTPLLIMSRDKDFKQLQRYPNVKQYDAIGERFIICEDPKRQLFEMICKGDVSDGIPNVVSPENSFVNGIRQKPMTQKKMDRWFEESKIDPEVKDRFKMNRMLIDLSQTPEELQQKILVKLKSEINKPRPNILNYFMKYNLSSLIGDVQNF
jgi:hypothetical protein